MGRIHYLKSIAMFLLFCSCSASFAEKTGRIAFISTRDGGPEVYVMNADGTEQRKLTFDTREKGEPSWSPDGRFIIYHCEDGFGRMGIYLLEVDGRERRLLTNLYDMGAVWSPDGESIAFHRYTDANWEIYLMDAGGSTKRNISRHPETDTYPTWSPDGHQLVFHSQRDGNWEIYTMNADGTDQKRLTQNDARDWVPAWSPGGEEIAFWTDRDGSWQIYLMGTDGSRQRRITKEPAVKPKGISRPAWSPDGLQIAFVSNRDGNSEIYVMNADGSDPNRLTFTDQEDYDPAWSRN